jgi:hypothetical protein
MWSVLRCGPCTQYVNLVAFLCVKVFSSLFHILTLRCLMHAFLLESSIQSLRCSDFSLVEVPASREHLLGSLCMQAAWTFPTMEQHSSFMGVCVFISLESTHRTQSTCNLQTEAHALVFATLLESGTYRRQSWHDSFTCISIYISIRLRTLHQTTKVQACKEKRRHTHTHPHIHLPRPPLPHITKCVRFRTGKPRKKVGGSRQCTIAMSSASRCRRTSCSRCTVSWRCSLQSQSLSAHSSCLCLLATGSHWPTHGSASSPCSSQSSSSSLYFSSRTRTREYIFLCMHTYLHSYSVHTHTRTHTHTRCYSWIPPAAESMSSYILIYALSSVLFRLCDADIHPFIHPFRRLYAYEAFIIMCISWALA